MVTLKERKGSIALLILASLLFCQLNLAAAAPTTSVIGWDMGPSLTPVGAGRTGAGKVLTVCRGDSVKFNWQGMHGVAQAKPAQWNACSTPFVQKVAIMSPGTWTVKMTTPGARYYYCQVPGHCAGGQKVKIVTKARPC